MKRRMICLTVLLFLILITLPFRVLAQEGPFGESSDYLPNEVYDYIEKEEIEALEKNQFDLEDLFLRIRSIWDATQPHLTKAFCQMLGMLLLFSAFRLLRRNTLQEHDLIHIISTLTFSLYAYQLICSLWDTAYQAMRSMHKVMSAMTPTVTTLYLLGGNETTAMVQGSLLTWFLGVMQQIMTSIFLPALQILMGFTLVGRIMGTSVYASIAQRLRKGLTWATGIFFGILSLVLGYQTSIAASADRLGAKALKFAFGSLIPVVGGAVSESVRTLLGSLSLLRSVTGTVGIICILMIVLPPLIGILCHLLLFSVLSFFAEWFCCQEEATFLSQLGELLKWMMIFFIAYGLFFIFFLTLFSNSASAYTG